MCPAILALTLLAAGCYSPTHSQEYFVGAANEDPLLEPIYTTPIYSVFFDRALMRCVIHSAHTWGQRGGGGGGTGIGVTAFRCDPGRIRTRARAAGHKVYRGALPSRQRRRRAPSRQAPSQDHTDSGGERRPSIPARPPTKGGN